MKEDHHLLGFVIWASYIYICHHPSYLIYLPHLIFFAMLMVHRLYLTKYKYSSQVSFEEIEGTLLAPHEVRMAGPPAKLPLNNFSILKNLADMNASTGEFLGTFDSAVNLIETWMNEPPTITYTKWLALLGSAGLLYTSPFFLQRPKSFHSSALSYGYCHMALSVVGSLL
jgi:hypothetical protein